MLLPKILLLSLAALLALQSATNSKQELNDQLFEAVRKGDVAAATAALDRGADVNAKFRYGTTALFKAAERGNAQLAKLLLDRGADVKVKDTFYGATAMTWALDGKHTEIVKLLLQKGGGEVDEVLITGVRESNPELVKVALENGGTTAQTLTAALALSSTEEKNAAITEMLKKAGAQPPLAVDAATLQSYAGTYTSDGPQITVNVKDGKLFVIFGRDLYQLMAIDKTTFRPIAFSGITVTFNGEPGKITGATLKQGPNATELKRVQ
jgi:ankyrin repeat protein